MATKYWSGEAMRRSNNSLDLEPGVFKKPTPAAIAKSLKRSAERSKRRKGSAYQSAMSMLNFFINRGGRNLSAAHKKRLEKAKDALRKEFGREPAKRRRTRPLRRATLKARRSR